MVPGSAFEGEDVLAGLGIPHLYFADSLLDTQRDFRSHLVSIDDICRRALFTWDLCLTEKKDLHMNGAFGLASGKLMGGYSCSYLHYHLQPFCEVGRFLGVPHAPYLAINGRALGTGDIFSNDL
jgi:hypothetical protein